MRTIEMINTLHPGREKQDKVASAVTEAVQQALKVCTHTFPWTTKLSLCFLFSPHDSLSDTHTHALQAEAKEGEEGVDVTVIAHAVEKHDYFENGQHF
jgi:hypothetical protein